MPDKILIIGSNSFSGTHFVARARAEGCAVVGVSRSPEVHPVFRSYAWEGAPRTGSFAFHQLDLNTDLPAILELVHDFKPDYVVNFAAQSMVAESWANPDHWMQTNLVANVRLHEGLRRCDFLKKYLHVSTPEVYGSCEGLIAERTVYDPSTPYAVSRAAADLSLMTYVRTHGFPVVFTRAANVYGPGQQLYRIIPRTILFFLTGRRLQLHGGGVSVRSFIHIRDVAEGTLRAMRQGRPGDIFHLSTPENITVRSLVERLAERMGIPFAEAVDVAPERPGKDSAYLLDSRKAKAELGWEAHLSLEQGLQETLDWVTTHRDEILRQPFDYVHKP
ncbi:MAG: GDP-mannose 4,6-dehydratase [Acidobacteria bacterium]|nr:GDP-mannose 4,6-dehydratase [Acidobacteriota bacterium]